MTKDVNAEIAALETEEEKEMKEVKKKIKQVEAALGVGTFTGPNPYADGWTREELKAELGRLRDDLTAKENLLTAEKMLLLEEKRRAARALKAPRRSVQSVEDRNPRATELASLFVERQRPQLLNSRPHNAARRGNEGATAACSDAAHKLVGQIAEQIALKTGLEEGARSIPDAKAAQKRRLYRTLSILTHRERARLVLAGLKYVGDGSATAGIQRDAHYRRKHFADRRAAYREHTAGGLSSSYAPSLAAGAG